MAREIDWTKPLSDEDRAWAEQRLDMPAGNNMNMRERIEANDQEHGREAKQTAQTRQERLEEIRAEMAALENEQTRLTLEQAEEDRQNAAFSGTPADARAGLGFVDNTPVNGETPVGATPNTTDDYEARTVPDLQLLIEGRNRQRQEDGLAPLSVNGRKAELIERLREDDRELAAAESEGE